MANDNRNDSNSVTRRAAAVDGLRVPALAALSLAALVAASLSVHAADGAAPEITAQGFDIADVREVPLGDSSRIRVRFEVPDRIAELYIRERSFEVDLASTPERGHFLLFGIERQPRQQTDVTLDFQHYINDKLDAAGDYEIEMRVSDRNGASASASLLIRVLGDDTEQETSAAVERAAFRFERAGAAAVSGADALGLSWKTIESNQVVIELAAADAPAMRFFETAASDYDRTESKSQLAHLAIGAPRSATLELATARGQAAGRVFGIVKDETLFIVKVTDSSTALSTIGTTVTIEGEYKY